MDGQQTAVMLEEVLELEEGSVSIDDAIEVEMKLFKELQAHKEEIEELTHKFCDLVERYDVLTDRYVAKSDENLYLKRGVAEANGWLVARDVPEHAKVIRSAQVLALMMQETAK